MRLNIKCPTAGKYYGTNEVRFAEISVNSAPEQFSVGEITPAQARKLALCLQRAADAVDASDAAEQDIAKLLNNDDSPV